MKIQFPFFLLAIAYLSGCAVAIPLHEAEPPETLGAGGLRVGFLTGTVPMVTGGEQSSQPNSEGITAAYGALKVQVGVADRLQIGMDTLSSGSGMANTLGAKYQWTGSPIFDAKANEWVISSAVKMISAAGISNTINLKGLTYYLGNVGASGYDINTMLGRRWTDQMGFYFGPKFLLATIKTDFKTAPEGSVIESQSRQVMGYGILSGVFLSPHSKAAGVDILLEGFMLNMPGTVSNDRFWYGGLTLSTLMNLNIPEIF